MTAYIRETGLLAFRSLRAVPRVPERILDVTLQPIIFILLFRYVFGAAIHVTGISYVDFLVPGIIAQGLAFGLIGTGTAISHDMTEGVLDRFRSMPVKRLSIVTGQVLGQYCEQLLGLAVYITLGFIVGFRPHAGIGPVLEALGLVMLALFAFTWVGTYFGMLVRSPEAMQGIGFSIVFPVSFMAGVFVPIAAMNSVLRSIGDWDPVSALVAGIRGLTENYPSHGSWLLDHGALAMLLWSLLLLVVFIPLSLRRFNRRLAA